MPITSSWPRATSLPSSPKKAFGALDVLVNNAGVYKFIPLEEITEDEFHREFNINVLGTILATKEAVRHFGPNGGPSLALALHLVLHELAANAKAAHSVHPP